MDWFRKARGWLVAATAVCSVLLAAAGTAAELEVRVSNIQSADGIVRIGLFNAAADFPDQEWRGLMLPAEPGTVTALFDDVPPGRYAVSAHHDLNENQRLDTSAIGRPVEPYGFSNKARGVFGPPSFDQAAFDVEEDSDTSVVIELK